MKLRPRLSNRCVPGREIWLSSLGEYSLTNAVFQLNTASNSFTIDLFTNALKKDPAANIVQSPSSVFSALTLLLAGLGGSSLSQLEGVMHISRGTLLEQMASLAERGGNRVVSEASSAWFSDEVTLLESYLNTIKTLGADSHQQVDFGSSVAESEVVRASINRWIAAHTNDCIRELLPASSINFLTRFVLVSAVHFLGKWRHSFSALRTKSADFTLADGATTKEVKMMCQTEQFEYFRDKLRGLAGLVMPYREHDAEMVVLLPDTAAHFTNLVHSSDLQDLILHSDSSAGWKSTKVSVEFPKLEFASTADLLPTLQSLGAVDLSDATKMNLEAALAHPEGHQIYVSNIFHQARVRVDELGTEAAAATAIKMPTKRRKEAGTPKPFICDRPFVFGIVANGRILFVGQVQNP